MIASMDEGVVDMLEYKDDGYIELVLKLLARICDGQHEGLQVLIPRHLIINDILKQLYCTFTNMKT